MCCFFVMSVIRRGVRTPIAPARGGRPCVATRVPAPASQRLVLPVIPSNPEPRWPFRSLRTSPTNVRAATHWDYLFRSRPASSSCKVFLDWFAGRITWGVWQPAHSGLSRISRGGMATINLVLVGLSFRCNLCNLGACSTRMAVAQKGQASP